MNISTIIRRFPLCRLTYDGITFLNPPIQIQSRPKVMRYSRWVHRTPSKVIFPENDIEDIAEEKYPKKSSKKIKDKTTNKSFSKPTQKFKTEKDSYEEQDSMSDEEDHDLNKNNEGILQSGTKFSTLINTDTTLSQLMLKVKSRKTREKYGIMMLEGKRLNQDAILAGLIPQEMFFSRKEDVESLSMPVGVVKLYKITYKVMQLWSSVQTAPGLVGFYKIPQKGVVKEDTNSLPLTIICDNVRDPGNVGAILRTASGVGCSKVLFIKGCADVWDSKVLRAGSGGHFRVPLEQDVEWDDINHCLDVNTSVLLADNRETTKEDEAFPSYLPLVPYHSVDFSAFSSIAIVIGSESEGLSKQAISLSRYRNGVRLHIPLSNKLDSLNTGAALSVILFEIKRQLASNQTEEIYYNQQ